MQLQLLPVEVSGGRFAAEESGADGTFAGTQRLILENLLPFIFDGRRRTAPLHSYRRLPPPRAILQHLQQQQQQQQQQDDINKSASMGDPAGSG